MDERRAGQRQLGRQRRQTDAHHHLRHRRPRRWHLRRGRHGRRRRRLEHAADRSRPPDGAARPARHRPQPGRAHAGLPDRAGRAGRQRRRLERGRLHARLRRLYLRVRQPGVAHRGSRLGQLDGGGRQAHAPGHLLHGRPGRRRLPRQRRHLRARRHGASGDGPRHADGLGPDLNPRRPCLPVPDLPARRQPGRRPVAHPEQRGHVHGLHHHRRRRLARGQPRLRHVHRPGRRAGARRHLLRLRPVRRHARRHDHRHGRRRRQLAAVDPRPPHRAGHRRLRPSTSPIRRRRTAR